MRALLAALLASCCVLTGASAATASPASLQAKEWWIGRLGLQPAWQITKGSGVTVAVIDSGLNPAIGDLKGAVVPGFAVGGASGNGETETDPRGHGTAMAVEIAGRGSGPGIIGVAPEAKIMPVYLPTRSSDTAAALDRLSAMNHPPQVVNMSYGTVGPCGDELQASVKKAVDKGLILVASAGNEGSTTNESQYPANCAGVVAVGAFDFNFQPWAKSQRQPYVSLGGPGVEIPSYNRALTTGVANGTSDAAAIVSGEFALLRAKFRTMPSRQLVARLFATASVTLYKGPGYGKSGNVLGFGPALVHQALIKTVPASAPNPIYDALDKIGGSPSGTHSSGPTHPSSGSGSTVAQSSQVAPTVRIRQRRAAAGF